MELGKFITFEGVEGAGKSTQINRVKHYLEELGIDLIVTREPGGTPIAEMLRDVLIKNHGHQISPRCELTIVSAGRLNHIEELIAPALNSGTWVLCDRYIDSSRVYQGYAGGLGIYEVNDFSKILLADKEITPDATVYIDVPIDIGLSRSLGGVKDEDRFENKDVSFHEQIRKGFIEIANIYKDRIRVIDGSKGQDEVFSDICNSLNDLIESN